MTAENLFFILQKVLLFDKISLKFDRIVFELIVVSFKALLPHCSDSDFFGKLLNPPLIVPQLLF